MKILFLSIILLCQLNVIAKESDHILKDEAKSVSTFMVNTILEIDNNSSQSEINIAEEQIKKLTQWVISNMQYSERVKKRFKNNQQIRPEGYYWKVMDTAIPNIRKSQPSTLEQGNLLQFMSLQKNISLLEKFSKWVKDEKRTLKEREVFLIVFDKLVVNLQHFQMSLQSIELLEEDKNKTFLRLEELVQDAYSCVPISSRGNHLNSYIYVDDTYIKLYTIDKDQQPDIDPLVLKLLDGNKVEQIEGDGNILTLDEKNTDIAMRNYLAIAQARSAICLRFDRTVNIKDTIILANHFQIKYETKYKAPYIKWLLKKPQTEQPPSYDDDIKIKKQIIKKIPPRPNILKR